MTNETLDKMWNILKENDFKIDVTIKSELKCTSCKNIMIRPFNVPCGCRYCYDCLRNYLNEEEKNCLGESEDCKSIFININENVLFDQAINIKISRIVVKCPLESCEFHGELRKMADHMRTCDRQPVICPYYTIGCDENKMSVNKMNQHFKQEKYCHARLLMDFVNNWRNEMKLLKTNILNLQEENKCINKQMESKQEMIFALEENVAKLLQESRSVKELETEKFQHINQIEEIILAMQVKSKEQNDEIEKNKKKLDEMETNQEDLRTRMEKLSQENKFLREELEITKLDNKAKKKIISALQTKSEEEEQEMEKVKEKCEFLEVNQEQMKTRIEELFIEKKSLRDELETLKLNMANQETILSFQTGLEEQKQEIKTNTEKMKDLKQKFDEKYDEMEKNENQMKTRLDKMSQANGDMNAKSRQSENAMKILETKLTQIQANQNCGEFLWCIENWEEKKERAGSGIEKFIYSDPFYSHKNGYQICLRLDPDGFRSGKGTHLSVYIYIMRGEFDNILQWPFQHDVKLEILNQETGLAHVSIIMKTQDNPSDNWKKPTSERNIGNGYPQFIKMSELLSNAALCQGNQIWIKATVQMKP